LVGRITGTVNGRPWALGGDERLLEFEIVGLASALSFRRAVTGLPSILTRHAHGITCPVRVRVRGLPAFTITPGSFLWSLLVPGRTRAGSHA